MIIRSVNVEDLSKFDYFNDAKDTIRWLQSAGRVQEVETLIVAYRDWRLKNLLAKSLASRG